MAVSNTAAPGGTRGLPQRFHRLALPLALGAVAIGAVALIGRLLDIRVLYQLGSDLPALRVTASLAVVVTGGSLALLADPPSERIRRVITIVLTAVAVICVVTLLGHAIGRDLDGGLDTPRSPHGALVALALVVWALTMDSVDPRIKLLSRIAAAAGILGATSIAIGYVYGVSYLSDPSSSGAVSPQGVLAIILIALSAAAARPETGIASALLSDDSAGETLRRMLPVAVIVPFLCGSLFVLGERDGWFGVAEGVLLVVVLEVLLFTVAVISTTRRLALAEHERDRLERKLESLADRDPLTDLFNRRRLFEEYARHVSRVARSDGNFALAMIDLDNLKPVNDRLGHAAGDLVLVAAAKVLHSGVRATDSAARIGGDEFALLIADVDEATAKRKVTSLLAKMTQLEPTRDLAAVGVTVSASAGIAMGGSARITLDELMRAADRALYEAKKAGRNQVRIANDQPAVPGPIAATERA